MIEDKNPTTVGNQPDDAEQEEIIKTFANLLKPYQQYPNPAVLDFGCGYQRMKKYFADWSYFGIDSNAKLNPPVLVKRGEKLSFRDQYFHLTISVTTLMHDTPEQTAKSISEITRVTQKFILIIEARRKPRFAYVHDYKQLFSNHSFEQILNLRLVTSRSPLAVWLFERKVI